MTIEEIDTVCFVGAGVMGCANSVVAAVSGYDALLFDTSEENLERAADTQRGIADYLVTSGYCSADAIPDALARISATTDLAEATAPADLVSESVYERLDVKRDVHARLDALCPTATILTTNTSALLVSEIVDVVGRGDRFAALHSHLGALLFDIVGGPETSAETIDVLRRYVLSLGGTPLVLKKEHRGYVLNTMIGAVLAMALRLVVEGHGSPEDVDRSWMRARRAPMGPFGMIDLFGLDLVLDSWRNSGDRSDRDPVPPEAISLLESQVTAGRLGMKSGNGFYDHPNPAYADPRFLETDSALDPLHRALFCALMSSAVRIVEAGVADRDDVDRSWMTGTHLDVGPFGIAGDLGVNEVLDTLDGVAAIGLMSPSARDVVVTFLKRRSSERA